MIHFGRAVAEKPMWIFMATSLKCILRVPFAPIRHFFARAARPLAVAFTYPAKWNKWAAKNFYVEWKELEERESQRARGRRREKDINYKYNLVWNCVLDSRAQMLAMLILIQTMFAIVPIQNQYQRHFFPPYEKTTRIYTFHYRAFCVYLFLIQTIFFAAPYGVDKRIHVYSLSILSVAISTPGFYLFRLGFQQRSVMERHFFETWAHTHCRDPHKHSRAQ